jgi:hypothetical protein
MVEPEDAETLSGTSVEITELVVIACGAVRGGVVFKEVLLGLDVELDVLDNGVSVVMLEAEVIVELLVPLLLSVVTIAIVELVVV